jgi:hypothetical protein
MKAKKPAFAPFENEADVVEVGQLALENRLDRITISGDVDLTADKPGLEAARLLHALLGQPGGEGPAGAPAATRGQERRQSVCLKRGSRCAVSPNSLIRRAFWPVFYVRWTP